MFSSLSLISKKGPFGVIWIAAHCLKRLKKHELMQTDVYHSVDNILEIGVPAVNHRILAFLLLGVVNIYSKKVEFLFHDCCDVLGKVGHLQGGKEAVESVEVLRKSYDFVSLPERFELDAFDLEILEYQNLGGKNVVSYEAITTPTGGRKMHSNDKYHVVEDTTCSELYPVCTPVRDVFSPSFVKSNLDVAMLCDKSNSIPSIETLCGKYFSDERLEPFDYAEKELGYDMLRSADNTTNLELTVHPDTEYMLCSADNTTNLELIVHPDAEVIHEEEHDKIRLPDEEKRNNMDNSCGTERVSEDLLASLHFEDMEELGFALLSEDRIQPIGEITKDVASTANIEELDKFINSPVKEKEVGVKEKSQSVSISFSLVNLRKDKQPLPINTDFASDSMFAGIHDSITVRTPATKEKSSLLKKRKCLFDGTVVLPNKAIKQMLEDSSDLVCKRKKAPHTVSQAWKARKISSLSKSFLEPLITCKATDFGSISNLKTSTAIVTEKIEIPMNQVFTKSLVILRSDEEAPIAPGTQASNKSLAIFGSDEETPIAPCTQVSIKSLAIFRSDEKALIAPGTQASNKSLVIFGSEEETHIAPCKQVSTKSLTTFGSDEETPIGPSLQVSTKSLAEETPIGPSLQVSTKSLATFGSNEETPIASSMQVSTNFSATFGFDEETPIALGSQVSAKSLAIFRSDEDTPLALGMHVSTQSATTFGSDEEAPIAPGTPVTQLTSLRMHEAWGLSRCVALRRSSSLDSFNELFKQDDAQEVYSSLTDKVTGHDKDAHIYEYSARTRKVASYLLKKLVNQRKLKGDECSSSSIGLSEIVESKSKRESARLFHEILVLKSGDYIQVKQENGYGEILLEETPRLKDFVSSEA